MIAIILAAGYGTRLLPLTFDKPKALLPVKGKTLLSYILEKIPLDMKTFVVSNEKFYLNFVWWSQQNKQIFPNVEIFSTGSLSVEDQKGGVNDLLLTLEQNEIDDDLLVVYGDNFFSFNLNKLMDFFNEKQASCLACYQLQDIKNARKFGVVDIDENNKIIDIEEKPQEPKTDLVVTGIYIIKKQDILKLKKYYEKVKSRDELKPSHGIMHFFQEAYKKQDVYAFPFSGFWKDIGTLKDYEEIK